MTLGLSYLVIIRSANQKGLNILHESHPSQISKIIFKNYHVATDLHGKKLTLASCMNDYRVEVGTKQRSIS
jgi:hypothetical protein